MASTEWVLSDDWKLWRDAQWGSRMNPFRVLRSAAFNTLPWEKLFAPFERFSCRSVICTRGVAIVAGEVVSKQIEKWCILRCCCFSLLRKRVLFCWGNLQRLFIDVCFLTSLTCLAESKWNLIWNCFCTTTLHGLKLSSRCTSKKKKLPIRDVRVFFGFDSWWKHRHNWVWPELLESFNPWRMQQQVSAFWISAEVAFKLLKSDYFCAKFKVKRLAVRIHTRVKELHLICLWRDS